MTLYEVCHWQQKNLYEKLLREDFIWNFQAVSPKKQSHCIQQQMTVTIREKNELRHVLLSCSELRLYSAKALGKYSKIRKHCRYLRFICLNTAFSNTQIDHETKENRWETFQKFSLKMKMKRKSFDFPEFHYCHSLRQVLYMFWHLHTRLFWILLVS